MAEKLKLWGRTTSSNVKKILWLAHALKLDFERIDAGGKFGVVDTPAYRALNPNGRVPTIEDGDFVLWESNSIMRYLCMKYGGEDFYPADPATRGDIDRWLDWSLSFLVPAETPLFLATIRKPPDRHDKTAIAAMTERAAGMYAIVDRRLEKRRYIAGEKFSLADIALSIYVDRWLRNPYIAGRPEFPHIAPWFACIRALPAFGKFVEIPLE
jgi:glutathione S-transferase